MQQKQSRKSCPHKYSRSHKRTSHSPSHPHPPIDSPKSQTHHQLQTLLMENARLRRQNIIFQEYFGVFQLRMKEQVEENDRLRKQLRRVSKGKESKGRNMKDSRCQTEPYSYRISRASKASKTSKDGVLSQYF